MATTHDDAKSATQSGLLLVSPLRSSECASPHDNICRLFCPIGDQLSQLSGLAPREIFLAKWPSPIRPGRHQHLSRGPPPFALWASHGTSPSFPHGRSLLFDEKGHQKPSEPASGRQLFFSEPIPSTPRSHPGCRGANSWGCASPLGRRGGQGAPKAAV